MVVLQKVASDLNLSEEEVKQVYTAYAGALKQELSKPGYREIVCAKLGTFKFKHWKIERMYNKVLRQLKGKYERIKQNEPVNRLGLTIAHALELEYYFNKLFKGRIVYTKNHKRQMIQEADAILEPFKN